MTMMIMMIVMMMMMVMTMMMIMMILMMITSCKNGKDRYKYLCVFVFVFFCGSWLFYDLEHLNT